MRLRSALALFAALVLAAAGCKPDTLTPFGVGTRPPLSRENTLNGHWTGTNSSGGTLAFDVASDKLTNITFLYRTPCGSSTINAADDMVPIRDNSFTRERNFTSQGRWVLSGHFVSLDTCVGTYLIEGLARTEGCDTRYSGTFTVERVQ